MEAKKEKIQEEKLPAEVRADLLSNETSVFFNVAMFEQAQRVATMFANSTMIPQHFQNNVGNCMIGLNYAMRLQADPFMVMQCLHIVHGNPGIEGKLVEAIINQSAKYSQPLEYEWLDPEDKITERRKVLKAAVPSEYGCQAFIIEAKSGKRVTGPKITWQLVKDNGWYDKKGPDGTVPSNKWRTMSEMMFYYRCASWFSNKNCPELKLGMHTVEELQDITEMRKMPDGSYKVKESVADTLKGKGTQPAGKDIYETKDVETSDKTEKKAEETSTTDEAPPYKNLTKLKFNKWMKDNADKILVMSQEDKDAIRAEFQKHFADRPYPLDEVLEKEDESANDKPEETKLSDMEAQQIVDAKILHYVTGSETDDMGVVLVPCSHRDETLIKYTMCNECIYQVREKCITWKEYDSQVGE